MLQLRAVDELGIAHAPENRRLFPRMTVEDNLRIGGYIPAARVQQVFGPVERIRARGLTVLIVEQNVRQALRLLEAYLGV
jgi:ABC-type branched-subunit amino acid transport system ATPase component